MRGNSGTSKRGGIGRGLPAAAAALEAGVGRKCDGAEDDNDDGEEFGLDCAGAETPTAPLPAARAESQGEGGFGFTRGSIWRKDDREQEARMASYVNSLEASPSERASDL